MKKILFVTACAFILTACAKPKNWECTCDYNSFSGGSGTEKYTINNKKQSEANSDCSKYGQALTSSGGSYKCKLDEI